MMRKLPRPLLLDMEPPRQHRLRRAVVTIAIGLALGPFVYEGSAVVAARWKAMMGVPTIANTPVTDALCQALLAAWHEGQHALTRTFHDLPWPPSLVIPAAIACAAFGCLLLGRCAARH